MMELTPWLPVFNETRYTMKPDRRGGESALFVDPMASLVNCNFVLVT